MSKQRIKVRISNNNGSRIDEIEDQFVKVGRDVKCGVSIQDDPSVSRMHAVIEVTPAGECAVIDLGSGITVNGKRVDKSMLVAGDGFTVGETSIEVISITPATSTVIRPPPVAPSAPMPAAKAQPRIAPPPPRRPEMRPVNPFVSAVRKLIARVVRAALEIEREER
jgi:pSer/pThr/pTyr-binding forkhead associated (FHA) protein